MSENLKAELQTEIEEKKIRRTRSTHNGGHKIMKGDLYARIQYQDDTGKLKEKLRRVHSGKMSDVYKEIRAMREELKNHGEETLNADKMTFLELAENIKLLRFFPRLSKKVIK